MAPEPRVGRRQLLSGGAAAAGGLAAGVVLGRTSADAAPSSTSSDRPGVDTIPSQGRHQAGIADEPAALLTLLGFDLRGDVDRVQLGRLMGLWTDDIDRLTRASGALADLEPELAEVPARLTVVVGWGPRIFSDVLSPVAGAAPPLPRFDRDRLESGWGQTDLVVQVSAEDAVVLAHAVGRLVRDARSFATVRWRQDGFRRPATVRERPGSMRNLFGQIEGTGNPVPGSDDFDRVVWIPEGPLAGGTHLVVRRIAFDLDGWEKVDRVGREFAVGRRLTNGAPLTGRRESDPPDYTALDEAGFPVIDRSAHIARARSANGRDRIFRRPYNYDGIEAGRWSAGLVFLSFQADLQAQFVPIQRRLDDSDRMNAWVRTVGSASYTVLPGRTEGSYLGESLID